MNNLLLGCLVGFFPVLGSADGFGPAGSAVGDGVGVGAGLEACVDARIVAGPGRVIPEADGAARQQGGAQRCGFGDGGTRYRDLEQVGLELQ